MLPRSLGLLRRPQRTYSTLQTRKAAIVKHANAVKTDVGGGLSYMFDIACHDYLCLPPSRGAEMLYFTLGKSPVLLCTLKLRREWVAAGRRVVVLPRRRGSPSKSPDNLTLHIWSYDPGSRRTTFPMPHTLDTFVVHFLGDSLRFAIRDTISPNQTQAQLRVPVRLLFFCLCFRSRRSKAPRRRRVS